MWRGTHGHQYSTPFATHGYYGRGLHDFVPHGHHYSTYPSYGGYYSSPYPSHGYGGRHSYGHRSYYGGGYHHDW